MSRSSSTTGILASLASFSTESQPVETTGARKMASTFCAMKERIALIWFSCFCCASAILRLTLRLLASCLETEVSAARQPDSDPICEKPMVSSAALAGTPSSNAAMALAAKRALGVIRRVSQGVYLGRRLVAWHPKTPFPGDGRYYFTEDWFRIVILSDYSEEGAG